MKRDLINGATLAFFIGAIVLSFFYVNVAIALLIAGILFLIFGGGG